MTKPKNRPPSRVLNDEELKSAAGGMSSLFLWGDTAILVTADAASSKVWVLKGETK